MSSSVVAVVGSREFSALGDQLVGSVARSIVASGRSLVVGCCSGVDEAVIQSGVPASSLRVFAAFGPDGRGACAVSAVSAVHSFSVAGGHVLWWAGGPFGVPLAARLSGRTLAVASSASAGLIAFFSDSDSRGSLLACAEAVRRGVPVVAFALSGRSSSLPPVGGGSWVASGRSGLWASSLVWQPAQQRLFTA